MSTAFSPDKAARGSELTGESCDLVSADLVARLAVLAVAMQRDRAAGWPERTHALLAVLDPELLVEQTPPDHDRLAGEFGVDLVYHARDGQMTVDAHQARRSGSRAKAQKRSQAHIGRTPSSGKCASQSSMRECGSER